MRTRYIIAIVMALPFLVVALTWLYTVIVARSRRRVDRCPKCKSHRVRPSWPKIVDVFLGISSVAAFRCEACLKRFYGPKELAYRAPAGLI
jgi:hypothetical protein